ncbi:DUF6778 family protein [Aquicoccus porphyridii]|uniref:DUF6778 family protein n=1 Tax=Aquicoccus porphyridii TaxID=1852029 RepID=UPI0035185C52
MVPMLVNVVGATLKSVRNVFAVSVFWGVAGCSSQFSVDYTPVPPESSKSWTVQAVAVDVPESLVVSTRNTLVPDADIVWYGDGPGDRRAQVTEIISDGIKQGVSGLAGPVPVTLDVELVRFHALTPYAFQVAPPGTGVESVRYKIVVRDAHTRRVLVPEEIISADGRAIAAKDGGMRGPAERKRIVNRIANVTQGWLGMGKDLRQTFWRVGQ